jgi:NAD(P)-dependent dehydrogenase (short-subunit alcohol dehydrogenase family)
MGPRKKHAEELARMTANRTRVWFITGVSSGFGRALAEAVLASGETVVGTVRSEAAKASFETLGRGKAIGKLLDVTDEAAVHATVKAAEEETGGIDILVNNAGYGLVTGVEEASMAEIKHQFEVNVFGAVAVLQAVLPFMRARRAGYLINITSVSGLVGWPSLGIYSGSKFALEGICETLAMEVAPLGIKLTMVEPGGFRTEFSGGSRIYAQRLIEDYDATVGESRRIMASHQGHEAGDPAKAAQAIINLSHEEKPPVRLLLGDDALNYVTYKSAAQQAEIDAWKPVTLAMNFD